MVWVYCLFVIFCLLPVGCGVANTPFWGAFAMVIKTQVCNFSQMKIYPGHGKSYVRLDSKVRPAPATADLFLRLLPAAALVSAVHPPATNPPRPPRTQWQNFLSAKCAAAREILRRQPRETAEKYCYHCCYL